MPSVMAQCLFNTVLLYEFTLVFKKTPAKANAPTKASEATLPAGGVTEVSTGGIAKNAGHAAALTQRKKSTGYSRGPTSNAAKA